MRHVFVSRRAGWSKLGGAYRIGVKLMTQFQTQVPDPLRNALPALLPARGLATPTIRVLFDILIGQNGFKSSTMEIQLHHIRSREALLGQAGKEEFKDDAFPCDANRALLFGSLMGCHHHTARDAFWSHWHIRAVIEATYQRAFGAVQQVVGGQMQTGLNQRMIEERVVFASHHEEETSQICNHCPRAILSIKTQQGQLL